MIVLKAKMLLILISLSLIMSSCSREKDPSLEDKSDENMIEAEDQEETKVSEKRSKIIEDNTSDFIPNLHRHGLIMFRICMILTVIRLKNQINDGDPIFCDNRDFLNALGLTLRLLEHSHYIFSTINNGILSSQDEDILSRVKDSFTRKDLLEVV